MRVDSFTNSQTSIIAINKFYMDAFMARKKHKYKYLIYILHLLQNNILLATKLTRKW